MVFIVYPRWGGGRGGSLGRHSRPPPLLITLLWGIEWFLTGSCKQERERERERELNLGYFWEVCHSVRMSCF